MKLNVAQAQKQPGMPFPLEASIEYPPLEYLGRELSLASPLTIKAEYVFDGGCVTVNGRAEALLHSECARCSKPFDEAFGFDIDAAFTRDAGPDDESYPYSGYELDLDQMLLDGLLLNAPMYSVCRPDCKGLCPQCGCDLNLTQCDCGERKTAGPFSALAALLDDNKEV